VLHHVDETMAFDIASDRIKHTWAVRTRKLRPRMTG
jgi:hypothetical protein